jgi:hypothetical protein
MRGLPLACDAVGVPRFACVDGFTTAGAASTAEVDDRLESGSVLAVRAAVGAGAGFAADG